MSSSCRTQAKYKTQEKSRYILYFFLLETESAGFLGDRAFFTRHLCQCIGYLHRSCHAGCITQIISGAHPMRSLGSVNAGARIDYSSIQVFPLGQFPSFRCSCSHRAAQKCHKSELSAKRREREESIDFLSPLWRHRGQKPNPLSFHSISDQYIWVDFRPLESFPCWHRLD